MVIKLTKGKKTRVDDDIPAWIAKKSWYAMLTHGSWYAASRLKGKIVLLHRVIVGAKPGEITDHINMNSLDNRKINLRCCTYGQNNCNRGSRSGGTSSYKGVSWHRGGQKWQVHIEKDRVHYYLGLFVSETKAALAYNAAAIRIHKQFAYLNKIGGQSA